MKLDGYLSTNKVKFENDFLWKNFEVKIFSSNSMEHNRSMMGRVLNKLIATMKTEILLPRIIIIVLDENLITTTKLKGSSMFNFFEEIINWLSRQFTRVIQAHKDVLPARAIKNSYPTCIWVAPPQNTGFSDNEIRVQVTRSIKQAILGKPDHIMLQLKNHWEFSDQRLVKYGSLTQEGFNRYWKAIDLAIQFWDRHLAPRCRISQNIPEVISKSPPDYKPKVKSQIGSVCMSFSGNKEDQKSRDRTPGFFRRSQCDDRFHWHCSTNRKLPTPSGYF